MEVGAPKSLADAPAAYETFRDKKGRLHQGRPQALTRPRFGIVIDRLGEDPRQPLFRARPLAGARGDFAASPSRAIVVVKMSAISMGLELATVRQMRRSFFDARDEVPNDELEEWTNVIEGTMTNICGSDLWPR